mmetsp:Transcript_12152/g.26274  ORF Transcript_12152/g.26274 Transcript_12152/m.26274 type:complete len:226 (+) Transcript_12152:121-798(+)
MVGPKLMTSMFPPNFSINNPHSKPACTAFTPGSSLILFARRRFETSSMSDLGFGAHPGYASDLTTEPPARKATLEIMSLVLSKAVPIDDRDEHSIVASSESAVMEIEARLFEVSTRPGSACEYLIGPCGSASSTDSSLLADASSNCVPGLLSLTSLMCILNPFSSNPNSSAAAFADARTEASIASRVLGDSAKTAEASRGIALCLSPPQIDTSAALPGSPASSAL